MSEFELIALDLVAQVEGKCVARLKLNRPNARNAFNNQMANELHRACILLANEKDVALTIIEAEGSVFCAGADVKERAGLDEDQVRARRLRGFRAYNALESLPMPAICVIDGPCVGSGVEIALSCDFIIASERATFRTPEGRWGTVGATQRLPRAIGLRRAKQMMFTGLTIDAMLAERWGIVNQVVQSEKLGTTIEELITEILQAPPSALRLAKRAMEAGFVDSRHGALAHEILAIEENLETGDSSGMQKALQK